MANAKPDRDSWVRCGHWWVALGAMLVIAATTLAGCDYFSEHAWLHLPPQSVTLDPEHPEYKSRFRVEFYDGRYELNLKFLTTTDATPTLDLQILDGEGDGESRIAHEYYSSDGDSAYGYLSFEVDCRSDFPCTSDLEVTAGKDPATLLGPGDSIEGVLTVSARAYEDGYGDPEGTYLAIEPLP